MSRSGTTSDSANAKADSKSAPPPLVRMVVDGPVELFGVRTLAHENRGLVVHRDQGLRSRHRGVSSLNALASRTAGSETIGLPVDGGPSTPTHRR